MIESAVQAQVELTKMAAKPSRKLRSRMTLVGVFLAFFGPIFIAIFMYSRLDIWQPTPSYNHGELLLPVQPLSMLELASPEGEAINLASIEGVWFYVYVGEGACGLDCEAGLFKVRQLRALLGRDLQRVQYLYTALDTPAMNSAQGLRPDHPRMSIGQPSSENTAAQTKAFGDGAIGSIYLLDPHGNLVMRYGKDAKSKGMLRDMRRLLKVSKIG